MPILIDGYNLLHVTGIFGRGPGPGNLERSRQGLLDFLAATIDPAELASTVIVFDSTDAPPGLPDTHDHQGITVHYARDYPDADTMLEELIAAHHVPRSLTVVSSDHRVQRAARRRRAAAVDSDKWYAEISQRRRAAQRPPAEPAKPDAELNPTEVEYWTRKFAEPTGGKQQAPPPDDPSLTNPFPPGYADDLLEDTDDA